MPKADYTCFTNLRQLDYVVFLIFNENYDFLLGEKMHLSGNF